MFKIIVFDLDQTLINETICQDTEEVLKKLKNAGYKLAIASYNKYAEWFCDRYNITNYFDIICAEIQKNKIKHFQKIINFYKLNNINFVDSDIIFFDDYQPNFITIQQKFNIKCHIVDKKTGIKIEDINWLL